MPGFNPCIPSNCKLPDDNLIVLSEAKILGVNTFEKEIAHELGHYFGLFHTFTGTEDPIGGANREKVTRGATKNCENVSDRFCQTEADPGVVLCSLNYPSDCQNTTPCGNNLLDQDGLEYKPLKFNLMSYYYLTTRCNSSPQVAFSFVDEQKNLMLYNLNNHLNRTFLKNPFQNLGIVAFHAGEIRKSKCDASLFINATPLKDVTVDIGSFGNKSCKTLPADCGHYIGQNDWASTGIQKILPFKDNDPTNGVTVADLFAIQQHILVLDPFKNAYQMIAADANNNGTISTGDIVLIRKLILGIKPNILTPSWRFLSQLHENEMSQTTPFADSNPFKNKYLLKQYLAVGGNPSYLDHVDIDYSNQNVAYDPINWSFRGIKMGDVDCSASALLKGGETPNESITTKNNFEPIPPNKTLVINVLRNKDIPIETYQMQLGYDKNKVELLSVAQGDDATNSIEDNFNTGELGKIRTVWTSSNNNKLDSKLQYSLFKLHFKTLSEIQNPDDLLHLSKEDFYNVFYNTNMLATNTDLTFLATIEGSGIVSKVQKTKSNTTVTAYPNPTNNEFYLNIPLSASGNIQIQVLDIVGKMLKNISIEGTEGQNEILINDLNLPGTNMLHYNIQTTEGNYQGKVLIAK